MSPVITTPLHWQEWDKSLTDHPDQQFRSYIVNGIRYGFRVGFNYAQKCHRSGNNLLSSKEQPQVVNEYLMAECCEGRVLGPLDPSGLPHVHTSRIGVIPKSTPGKWRLIVDMSSPEGFSVNDGIPEALCSLSYVTINDAVQGVLAYRQGALLAKVDIRSAYRTVPVHPDDHWLMGMSWEESLFIDTALPFGLRSAPKIFTAVADAAEWILRQAGVDFVLHYLDDFLLIGPPDSPECAKALHTLLTTFHRLGLPIAEDKLVGPTSCLTFLGFEIDTMSCEVRLPEAKLAALHHSLLSWIARKSCTRKELESITGRLAHASHVVQPGKTFMSRLFALLSGAHKAHHHIRLSQATRSDMLWWATFVSTWNGISFICPYTSGQFLHEI